MRAVKIGSLSVVVVRTPDGELYALHDRCPHKGAQLSFGLLQQMVVGNDVGEYQRSNTYLVRCPWHRWEFEVGSGRCLADPEHARVRTYSVEVEDGTVVLERPGRQSSKVKMARAS
jgi:nitrite reductase (NADH) small subunit